MQYRDYYEILGVPRDATQDQIKKAYRKLAKAYHPDAHPGSKEHEEKFKQINEAYEVLGNPENRRKYDQLGSRFNFANGFEFDPSQFGFGNMRYEFRNANTSGFSDFFDMFFGPGGLNIDELLGNLRGTGFGGSTGSRFYSAGNYGPMKGEDREYEIRIPITDGLKGAERRISIDTPNGRRTVEVKIPRGIQPGGKIRLQGLGGKGAAGRPNGDLYLVVRFLDDGLQLKGHDIIMDLPVYPWVAALGGEQTVNTPDGRIMVRVPEGIQSGGKIRIPGKGYYTPAGGRGDLFLSVRLVNPSRLTPKQRKLYEQLRDES
ncbi:MAG: DnaJ domain-containing protein [Clostridiaceae bacterium]|nr:DnaJ domain-containing protein [Clostridiaceae bacterium]